MTWNIADRLCDHLDRQIASFQQAIRDWEPFTQHDRPYSDDELAQIESLQQSHNKSFEAFNAEQVSLRKEWDRSNPTEEQRAAVRERRDTAMKLLAEVQAAAQRIAEHVFAEMEALASSSREVKRGRRMTRDYGGSRSEDARYMDRQA